MMARKLGVMADETGAVVLCVFGDGRPTTPVSQQNGNWDVWVNVAKSLGADPGEVLGVMFDENKRAIECN